MNPTDSGFDLPDSPAPLDIDQLRIDIAQACGKRVLRSCGDEDADHKNQFDTRPNSIGGSLKRCRDCDAEKVCSVHGDERFWSLPDSVQSEDEAPDYPRDLNAMREAVSQLRPSEVEAYTFHLERIVKGDMPNAIWAKAEPFQRYFWMMEASALQRARAFRWAIVNRKGAIVA